MLRVAGEQMLVASLFVDQRGRQELISSLFWRTELRGLTEFLPICL